MLTQTGHYSTTDCGACHTVPAVAGQTFSFQHQDRNETGLTQCLDCHTNLRPNQAIYPTPTVTVYDGSNNPVPFAAVVGATHFAPTDCAACHAQPTTSGSGAAAHLPSFPFAHQDAAGIPVATCLDCHPTAPVRYKSGTNYIAHEAIGARDCSDCHYNVGVNWAADNPHTSVPTAATLTSCNTCHIAQRTQHPNPNVPMINPTPMPNPEPTHIATPRPAPNYATLANHFTSVDCVVCHIAKDPVNAQTFEKDFKHNTGVAGFPSTCATCHTSMAPAYSVMGNAGYLLGHPKTQSVDCGSCHTANDSLKLDSNNALTAAATTNMLGSWQVNGWMTGLKTYDHKTTSGGALTSCTDCHAKRFAAVAGHPSTSAECNTCHSSSVLGVSWGAGNVHTPGMTECASCHGAGHTPGNVPASTFMTTVATAGTSTAGSKYFHSSTYMGSRDCYSCHGNSYLGQTAPRTGWQQYGKFGIPHSPSQTTGCATCHTRPADSTLDGGRGFRVVFLNKSGDWQYFRHTKTGQHRDNCQNCHTPSITFRAADNLSPWNVWGAAIPDTTTLCQRCHR